MLGECTILVLTRRVDEVIKIGDDIEIMVVKIDGRGQVKLGITAPKDVVVDRLEVYERRHSKDV